MCEAELQCTKDRYPIRCRAATTRAITRSRGISSRENRWRRHVHIDQRHCEPSGEQLKQVLANIFSLFKVVDTVKIEWNGMKVPRSVRPARTHRRISEQRRSRSSAGDGEDRPRPRWWCRLRVRRQSNTPRVHRTRGPRPGYRHIQRHAFRVDSRNKPNDVTRYIFPITL